MVRRFRKKYHIRTWAEIDADIQKRAIKKDKNFNISGNWKKFVRMQDNFKIFAVNGEWVKNNLSVTFGHGGHGYVHEFIPCDEIWINLYHFSSCGCKNAKEGDKVSVEFFESTTLHELFEAKQMKSGMNYSKAHRLALAAEKKLNLIESPYSEGN